MPQHNILHTVPKPLAGILLLLALNITASACSVSYFDMTMKPDFQVVVNDGKAPLSGIKVLLFKEHETQPFFTAYTNKAGTVDIQNLAVGKYFVSAVWPGGGGGTPITVKSNLTWESRAEVLITWPGLPAIQAKALKGRFVSHDPRAPFRAVNAKLWRAGDGVPLAAIRTGADGQFEFKQIEPGVYLVEIAAEGPAEAKGSLAIDLLPSGAQVHAPETLDLALSEDTCGLSYTQCNVPSSPIPVYSRKMHVVDINGRGLEATYHLITPDGKAASQKTDALGIAEIPLEPQGSAIISIEVEGYAPLRQEIQLFAANPYSKPLEFLMVPPSAGCGKVYQKI